MFSQRLRPIAVVTRVIADVDTGIDDSLALLYLLGHPAAEIAAIISTAGNVPVSVVAQNNLGWLTLLGGDALEIDVALGSAAPLAAPLMTTEDTHGPLGIGYAELPIPTKALAPRDGIAAWLEITAESPGEIVGLVTGPTTTLARAIRIDPTLPNRLRRLVIMGGAFHHPGNTTPTSEWNVAVDPEALHEVLVAVERCQVDGGPAPLPIICPLDLTETIEMTPDHLLAMAEAAGSSPAELLLPDDANGTRSVATNPVIRAISDAVRFYFEFHRDVDGAGYVAHMHDPFAAAVALNPAMVRTREATVDVECTGLLTRGTTIADYRHHWARPVNAAIATETDPAAFFDDLVEKIGTLSAGRLP